MNAKLARINVTNPPRVQILLGHTNVPVHPGGKATASNAKICSPVTVPTWNARTTRRDPKLMVISNVSAKKGLSCPTGHVSMKTNVNLLHMPVPKMQTAATPRAITHVSAELGTMETGSAVAMWMNVAVRINVLQMQIVEIGLVRINAAAKLGTEEMGSCVATSTNVPDLINVPQPHDVLTPKEALNVNATPDSGATAKAALTMTNVQWVLITVAITQDASTLKGRLLASVVKGSRGTEQNVLTSTSVTTRYSTIVIKTHFVSILMAVLRVTVKKDSTAMVKSV